MKRTRSKTEAAELWAADDPALSATADLLPRLQHGGRRLLRFLRYYSLRRNGPDLMLVWVEVASFMRLCPGTAVPVRRVLDHLSYLARKNGRQFTISHEYTAYLGRLLKAWGVPVSLGKSMADEVPDSWWALQPCPSELRAATAAAAETPILPGL